ncbi:MAG: SurA N-terminal domain-containing protein [Deltaproteobacteria bacterium]|nr:SurA N-terminal domain-containing protein [Deltaproteobacteria bacterium]
MKKILKKGLAILATLAVTLGLLALGVSLFRDYYKKQLWDPRTAATVNGVPILRDAVDEVLRVGSNPPLTAETDAEGSISIRQILDKLIEEELVRQAAEREGIVVADSEVAGYLDEIRLSWGCREPDGENFRCQLPKGKELDSLVRAIRQRLLLEKTAALVSGRKGRRSKIEWEKYLEEWTVRHSLPGVFKARAILADKSEEVLKLLTPKSETPPDLKTLEAKLKEAGAPYVVSETLYLNPRKPAAGLASVENLREILLEALDTPGRLTPVIGLNESYAVLEVTDLLPAASAGEMALAARRSYEDHVREKAFREFLEEIRAAGTIEINPNFPGIAP